MFGLTKKMFIGLLISIVNAFNHTRCVTLRYQNCRTQPTQPKVVLKILLIKILQESELIHIILYLLKKY